MHPQLSVIIPAYNEEGRIRECLESILRQNTSVPFEVLICDDASSDATAKILTDMESKIGSLTVLRNQSNQGIVKTLDRLVQSSKGDFLVRVDADSVMLEGTLTAFEKAFESGADLVFGKISVLNTQRLHPAACQLGKQRGTGTWYGGACFSVRKKPFIETGGWIKRGEGQRRGQNEVQELKDRAQEHGWSVEYLDDVGVESEFPVSLSPVLKRKYYSTKSYLNRCAEAPEQFSLSQIRGPLYWITVTSLAVLSALSVVFLFAALILLSVSVLKYGRDAVDIVSISGQYSFLVAYPVYEILSGLTRTVGFLTEVNVLFKIAVIRTIGSVTS